MLARCLLTAALLVCGVPVALAAQAKPLRDIALHPLRSASATALSLNEAPLSAQIQADVESIPVRVSQRVKKGDVLVKLDCADYQLALQLARARVRAAEARLTLARSQRDRTGHLLSQQLTSQEMADTADAEAIARSAEHEEAQIGQRSATLDVSRCEIKAPFDGIVTERNIAEGQLASVGSPLVTVVETGRIELSARIDPADIPLLRQAGELYFDDGAQVPVSILHLGGVIDPSTRNQEVRFTFPDKQPLPGTAGKLVWRDPRPFVPAQYIVKRKQHYGVFVRRNGVAEFVALESPTPGRANPVDLPPDTLIVVDGLGTLEAGEAL